MTMNEVDSVRINNHEQKILASLIDEQNIPDIRCMLTYDQQTL